ncbi:winged helix-turn-helix transcriptional regulator [Bailinhaonella thermotolerans]|uniref:Transcriptional regulator n=1 Tax=Bailinhaonella thermotolerans TaxID=1070861 RepID=A0A3A4AVA2_9ACTN|nr:helix-turn-helix domain-containing protein [Bailinhaonella thermotolerans]RJL34160.1 transcriptional regulator [Bailinhaonella thermotolerans]
MGTFPDLRKFGGADAFLRACKPRVAIELLSDKWSMLVLGALLFGPRRFGELRRMLDGITPKMLTRTLRSLERDGLLTRTVYPTVPMRVEYALTDLGESAAGMLAVITTWGAEHAEEILAARRAYDARPPAGETPVPA